MPPVFKGGKLLFKDGKVAFAATPQAACQCCDPCILTMNLDFEETSPLAPGECLGVPFGQQTVTIPESVPLPCYMRILGFVDDELVINGQRLDPPGTWPFSQYPGAQCNAAHSEDRVLRVVESGEGDIVGRTFTIAGIENFGRPSFYNLTLCFAVEYPGNAT